VPGRWRSHRQSASRGPRSSSPRTKSLAAAAENATALTPVPFPVNITPVPCGGTITTGGTSVTVFSGSATKRGYFFFNQSLVYMWISFTGNATVGGTDSYPIPPGTLVSGGNVGGGSFSSPPGFGMNTPLTAVSADSGTVSDKYRCTYY
jgi:hypothetical protein